jgi:hypothetical protein
MPSFDRCVSDAHNVNQSVHSIAKLSYDQGQGHFGQSPAHNNSEPMIIPDDPTNQTVCASSTVTANCDNNLNTEQQPASPKQLLISKDDKKEPEIPAFDRTKLIAAIRKRKHRTVSKVRKTVAQRLAEKLRAVQPPCH